MLKKYREQIDLIDMEIVELIWKRMQISESIWIYKKEHGIAPLQTWRRWELLDNRKEQAQDIWLDPDCIGEIYEIIHKYSLSKQ